MRSYPGYLLKSSLLYKNCSSQILIPVLINVSIMLRGFIVNIAVVFVFFVWMPSRKWYNAVRVIVRLNSHLAPNTGSPTAFGQVGTITRFALTGSTDQLLFSPYWKFPNAEPGTNKNIFLFFGTLSVLQWQNVE